MLHLPGQRWEWPIFLSFWIGGALLLFYEIHVVMKSYYVEWWKEPVVKVHLAAVAFLAFSIYSNMIMLLSTGVFYHGTNNNENSQNLQEGGWKFCEKCKREAPPRSHHCKLCDQCILKRDHHCWFTAYCIGYQNHRYYVCMTFYCCVAAVYGNLFNWDFVLETKGGLGWTTIPSFLVPHIGLIFGFYTLYEFAITAITSIGILFTFIFFWLFLTQCAQIRGGQVQYELKKGIKEYSVGLHNSLNEIFGSAGLLVFLCPFIPTTFPGDGMCFPRRSDKLK